MLKGVLIAAHPFRRQAAEGIEAEDLKVGQKVQVTYSNVNGKTKVSALHVVK